MKDKEKTALILKFLKELLTTFGRERHNIVFPELRLGSGYCGVSQRRIDLFCISSDAGNTTTAYEIKVSRQDFKKDVNDDFKQRGARLYANYFYYVTPVGLLKPEEIPLWAGLMEIDLDKYKAGNFYCPIYKVSAPLMPKAVPSWGLICSMVRHINKDLGNDPFKINELTYKNNKLTQQVENMRSLIRDVSAMWKKEWDGNTFTSLRLEHYK